MAEFTGFRNNVREYVIWGLPYVLEFPIWDNDGDLVSGAAGLDSEIAKNGDTPADCTNEAVEIGSSGRYRLSLEPTESQSDNLSINIKTSTTDAKTTVLGVPVRKLPKAFSGTATGGSSSEVILPAGASAVDGAYAGCVAAVNIDGTLEARIVISYDGASRTCTVNPNWVTASPDSSDAVDIYVPDGVITPLTAMKYLGESALAATLQSFSAITMLRGAAESGATTTTLTDSTNLTQGEVDNWKGRIIIFTGGALAGQASRITAFDPTTDTLTFEALSSAPAASDPFIIV